MARVEGNFLLAVYGFTVSINSIGEVVPDFAITLRTEINKLIAREFIFFDELGNGFFLAPGNKLNSEVRRVLCQHPGVIF